MFENASTWSHIFEFKKPFSQKNFTNFNKNWEVVRSDLWENKVMESFKVIFPTNKK